MTGKANWITSPEKNGRSALCFKKQFDIKREVRKASLTVASLGVYNAYVNGERISDYLLMPGWTAYDKRVQYQTYDITDYLKKENLLKIEVGAGWATGHIGYGDQKNYYANNPSLTGEIYIEYEDGEECIVTDNTWGVYTSKVLESDIYDGETVDLTAEEKFIGNAEKSFFKTKLIPHEGEYIKEQEKLSPISFIITPKGEKVIDFGQNMTGYVKVSIKAPRGSKIKIHHAEVLDREGNFYRGNYRKAKSEAVYICSGGDDEFKPMHTFYGFRYIRLSEYPFEEVDLSSFCAVCVHSDIKRTGSFVCGNDKINQLYKNIIWGQKSNFLDVPTDCPQRDERLGWSGDAQVFCRTAAINYDVLKFFRKWLGDMRAEQGEKGEINSVIPHCIKDCDNRISAAWGDAAVIIPWELYKAYGDKNILSENFEMMKKWVEYIRCIGDDEGLWLTGCHFGDWLSMDCGEDSYVGKTANDLIATAFYAYSTSLLVKAGEALGKDMSEYKALYKKIRASFREYFMEEGMPKESFPLTEISKANVVDTHRCGITQTALVLILHFGLCEEWEKDALSKKLCELIEENDGCMTTGFVGTPYILHALSDSGHTHMAYNLLFQEKSPSWLYSVNHGATTMWEHWNSIKEDGSFWSDDMNSFNHYAYGSVFDWIFGKAVGIVPSEKNPGYKEVYINPHPDKRVGFMDASYESAFGTIRVYWYYRGDEYHLEAEIPEGVTAHVKMPSGQERTVCGGRYIFCELDA